MEISINVYPGKADRSALGQNAAGRKAGPHGGNRIGDQVRNGAAVVGPIVMFWGSSVAPGAAAGIGDGVHRLLFFASATVASFFCTASFTMIQFDTTLSCTGTSFR